MSLGGLMDIAMNETLIPASVLSEVEFELEEGVRERETLAGKYSRPSGTQESSTATFTIFLPNLDYLKNIFPGRYNAPTGPQTVGNIIVNANECVTTDAGPVNFHYTCDTNDANDIYFYNASALLNFNGTVNNTDDFSIEVTLYAEPDENGNVYRLGTGSLTAESVYDPETETTGPVES